MPDSRYQQALDYLYSFIDYETMHRWRDAASFDLRRMDELLARLGKPQLKAKSVHIAGTKGKGSTAAMVASALAAAGYKTGLYTSPHLSDLRERIRVDGELIPEAELVSLVARLKPEVEVVNRKASYGQLTTFELLTALGFLYFALEGVDFQVVEAGLGGRLDATNVLEPEVCVITSINLDHTDVLGSSLAEIAAEKAGIIKPGSVVVCSPQPDEVARVIEETCLERGVGLVRVGSDVTWEGLGFDAERQLLRVSGRLGSYRLSLPLLGRYQLENAATAVAALEVLAGRGFSISRDSIRGGLERVSWPGRFQILGHNPLIVVDGAHNPASARGLKQSLEHYLKGYAGYKAGNRPIKRAILVIGTSCDKDIAAIVPELSSLFATVIATRSRHPRAMATAPIVAEFGRHGLEALPVETVSGALKRALALAGDRDLICVTGSLFVVAEAIEQLSKGTLEG
ncbi:MAG: folylpolyglutamate synthase/dihydrofolate synthase family protein [Dehalococcoidales bacterium]